MGVGYRVYDVAVARTMRKESRGLERARHEVNIRRTDEGGCVIDIAESCEDASGGN